MRSVSAIRAAPDRTGDIPAVECRALTVTGSAVRLRTRGNPVTDWTADQAPPVPVTTLDIGTRLPVGRPGVTTTANWLPVGVGSSTDWRWATPNRCHGARTRVSVSANLHVGKRRGVACLGIAVEECDRSQAERMKPIVFMSPTQRLSTLRCQSPLLAVSFDEAPAKWKEWRIRTTL